jgi:hypothetical protein
MGASARFFFATICTALLFTVSAFAQQPVPPDEPQDDSMDTPLQRARAQAKAQQTKDRSRIERDDPRARLDAQRAARGIPSQQYKEHLFRLRQAQAASRGGPAPFVTPPFSAQWVPIGPTGADYQQNGTFTIFERDSGRARTILPHPTDPDTLYFLTSGGGLWVTNNFTASSPTWRPLTDSLPTTAGGSVSFGRTPLVLYLGLGDPFDVINVGGAMVKSIDGGANWTNIVDLGTPMSVRDVKVDISTAQDIVLVATDTGLFRSPDGGLTYASIAGPLGVFPGQAFWSLVRTSAGWLVNAQPCSGVPATSCGTQATIYLSTDQGLTWAAIPNTGNVYTGAGRTTLGVGTPGDSVVYAFAENSASTDQLDLFKSTNGGLSWTALSINGKVPTNMNGDNPNMDLMHGQSFYNQMILVDPNDVLQNTVYLGGDLSSAKTTDGGLTWTLTSNWLAQFGLPYVHADMHAAALSLTTPQTVLFGSDGGIFTSLDSGTTFTSSKNNGLQTFLVYSLSTTPVFPSAVLFGSQDNGTRIRKGNTTIYNQSRGGDGIGTGWSQANANAALVTVPDESFGTNLTNQIPDINSNFVFTRPPLVSDALFFTPVETPTATADPTGKVFFTSSRLRVYKTVNGGFTWTVIGAVGSTIVGPTGLRATSHGVGVSPVDLMHLGVIAAGGHAEFTINGGTNWTDVDLSTLFAGTNSFTSSFTWADNQTMYVTSVAPQAGVVRVAKSSDSGVNWARADGGLPDVPVNRVILDPRDATHNTLLAASLLGVFRTTDGGMSWVPYGTGLPNAFVADISMTPDGNFLRLATYGRGIWELPFLTYVGATLTDDITSCDHDGVLDNAEQGHLTITLHNDGATTLSGITATITSTNPNVSFPSGNTISFPSAAPGVDTTAAVIVAMSGAAGIQQIDFTIAFNDPALGLPAAVTATASFRASDDEVPNGSTADNIEATNSPWTVAGTPPSIPDSLTWEKRQITPIKHLWAGQDSNALTDVSLVSPVMQVGGGNFSISFEQRYLFEFQGAMFFDGMVLELSQDAGVTWTDIGGMATPSYDHTLEVGGGNVLGGRMAYSGRSPGYPSFESVTVNLGTAFAGKPVQIRFRIGTDPFGGSPGVEIRNIATTGLTNTPFTAVVADRGICSGVTLTSIAVTPANPSIAKGLTQQFTAIGTFSSGPPMDITATATWSSSNMGVATIGVNTGLATGAGVGMSSITATQGAITSNTAVLTVTAATLVSIAVTPTNPSIAKGLTQQFTAIGTFTDTSTLDVTTTASWASATTTVGTIGLHTGLATGAGVGTSNITAAQSGVTSNTAVLTVTAATLVSIAVTPTAPSIAKGLTQQFTAIGTFTDNSTLDVTTTASWASATTTVATIGLHTGLATGAGVGTSNITAAQSGVTSNTAVLTVTAATLVSIAVTPTAPSIAKGLTQQFTAIGTFTDNSTLDVTTTASWASATTTVATIGLHTGLATGAGVGTSNITAAQGGVTSNTAVLTVTPAATSTMLASVPNPTVFGQSVMFTATVTSGAGTPTGMVTFFDGPTMLGTLTLNGAGVAILTTSTLAPGVHSITVNYGGNANLNPSMSPALIQNVNKAGTTNTLMSSLNPSAVGQAVTFTATFNAVAPGAGVPTGMVTFFDGGTPLGTFTLSAGVAMVTTSALTVGPHSITANYAGDANFAGSLSGMFNQTVNLTGSSTALASSANPSVFGQAVMFTATVTGSGGPPTGMVTFLDGAATLGTATLSAGVATFSTSTLVPGTHSITAMYGGDVNFGASTSTPLMQTVNKASSTTAVASSANPSTFGQSVTFTATINAAAPGAGTPSGMVTFLDGATTLGTATLNGAAMATFTTSTLAPASHSITVQYAGDANFTGSTSAVLTQTVSKANSTTVDMSSANATVFGQSVTFTATTNVVSPGAGTPGGMVTFLDGATTLGTATLNGTGMATFTTSTLAPSSHSITAMYAGNASFNASTSAATAQTVSKANSTTLVISSVNPTVFGQSVTFTARVNAVSPGAGIPSGMVNFLDGATQIGTGTLNASGVATFQTPTLSPGSHTISASYLGDADFNSGSSANLTQTVTKASTITILASLPNPSSFGASVTFTATINVVAPGSGSPSGTVTFFDGATTLGTGALNAQDVATISTMTLILGFHAITATYAGDANFTGSTSITPVTQVVKTGTTTVVMSSLNPSNLGQNVTFTATVTAASGMPTGTVNFFDGATLLGASVIGVGTVSTTTLTSGTHTITAQYSGDPNFNTSTSAPLTQTVTTPDYSVTAAPTALTITAGQSGNITFTVTPINGSKQVATFSCNNLPLRSMCTFVPPSVTLNGVNPANSVGTIMTTANTAVPFSTRPNPLTPSARPGLLVILFGLALLLLPMVARRVPRRLAFACAVLGLTVGLGACVNTPKVFTGTPPGTYTVNVVATAGGTSHTVPVTITVQ